MKKLLAALCAVLLLTGLAGCGKKEEPRSDEAPPQYGNVIKDETTYGKTDDTVGTIAEERSEYQIIQDMISIYGTDANEDGTAMDTLFRELEAVDEKEAGLWRSILDYWSYVRNEMPVNLDRLPEGLSGENNMAIVVLGFELNPDGTMKDELIGRLGTALVCAKQYPNAYIICTGGATAVENPAATEAGLMGAWLVKKGIASDRIIIEDRSYSTAENAQFVCRILEEHYPQIDSVAIVSSRYHVPWGSLLFEASFLKEASENGGNEIHVVSNAAFPVENGRYGDELRFQKAGLLQLAEFDR